MMRKFLISLHLLLCILCTNVYAQKNTFTIQGKVSYASDNSAIEGATVIVQPHKLYSMSFSDGRYNIKNIPAGSVKVEIQFFGMNTYDTTFVARPSVNYTINARLTEADFRIDEVVVVAKKSEAGSSTASEISRQAMDHMQTSSLKDVMTLLPGVALSNPNLSSAQTISIRNNIAALDDNSSVSPVSSMNALGTSVIVDGAPLSNNANLQFLGTAQAGDTMVDGGVGRDAASGVDIRSLSTDNIESVEVIRGIPSAQYGDLTSGAVIVKSRAGKSPLNIRFKTNPNIYQASASKGFSLGKKTGDLNISGDYAYNRSALRAAYQSYQRASVKGLWSVRPSEIVSLNNSISLSYGNDRSKLNPDFESDKRQYKHVDLGFIINSNGNASFNNSFFKALNWSANINYTDKKSHYENTATNALNLYSTAMGDGMIYTNVIGQQIFDSVTGEEITNPAGSGVKGVVLPYSYFYTYDILGKEFNAFAKLNAEFAHTWGSVSDRLLVGADYKADGNFGEGAIYDDEFPPFRNVSNAASGYRRRAYHEIPFVHQIGAYAENHFKWSFADRNLNITAGLRYLWVNGLSAIDPRINASIDIMPWMTLRGGWGYASKAPTSLYLNPNYAYHDEILFNGMQATLPEEEKLLVAKTNVYDAHNPNLEIARNRKAEIGLDFMIAKRYKLFITAYHEKMNNGYSYSLLPESFKYYRHSIYESTATNAGSVPSISKKGDIGAFFLVYMPSNTIVSENSGIEYELDLGRFEAIRTSFSLNGAWTYGAYSSNGYTYNTSVTGNRSEHHIGIYEPGLRTRKVTSHITTLRITHNIPKIGFVVTLTTQFNWMNKSWNTYKDVFEYLKPDSTTDTPTEYNPFYKYLSYEDGKVHDIEYSEALFTNPEFSYLCTPAQSTRNIADKTIPYVLFNLNLTKEIGKMATASFYVNNVFNSRPLYRTQSSGTRVELGIPIFFGFEFKVKL